MSSATARRRKPASSLARETYPGKLNVTFTRGFISSQAFVDRYVTATDGLETLIPATADEGLDFVPTHPKADEALQWMGFEARSAILEVLDEAIADTTALVRVIAYDLNDPAIVTRLQKLKRRLRVIIDNSGEHKADPPPNRRLLTRLAAHRRHRSGEAPAHEQPPAQQDHRGRWLAVKAAVCGSTNFSWRGQFVQSNNAIVVRGKSAIQPFIDAFENYWENDFVKGFGPTDSTEWHSLKLAGIDAQVTFSPHSKDERSPAIHRRRHPQREIFGFLFPCVSESDRRGGYRRDQRR